MISTCFKGGGGREGGKEGEREEGREGGREEGRKGGRESMLLLSSGEKMCSRAPTRIVVRLGREAARGH